MLKQDDPKGLIHEAYNIEGIAMPECRTIFLDWAIGAPQDHGPQYYVKRLLAHYGPLYPDHPMTEVLRDALKTPPEPKRRGGRAARLS